MPTFDPNFWAGHEGQSYNSQTGTWNPVGSAAPNNALANYHDTMYSGQNGGVVNPTIRANQQAMGGIYADGTTDASRQYNAWVAAGKPATMNGQVVDSRGAPMANDAWDSTFQNMMARTGGNYTPGSEPLINPNSPWANGQGAPAPAPGTLGAGSGEMPGGNFTGDEQWYTTDQGMPGGEGGQLGSNGFGLQGGNTTLGNLAGGNMNIPGGQPNYPLNIGAYLNPMLGYGLQQGMKTINNSAAARGSLNSGDTLKELFGYGMGQGTDAFNKAAGIAGGQQGFAYGVDAADRQFGYNAQQADRDFGYRAATGDRDFNFQRALSQAGLGLQATGQQNAAAIAQAQILAQLGLGGAQAAGAGMTNQGNTVNQAIQNLISQYLTPNKG